MKLNMGDPVWAHVRFGDGCWGMDPMLQPQGLRAREFGVTGTQIANVARGRQWKGIA